MPAGEEFTVDISKVCSHWFLAGAVDSQAV